MTALRQLLLSLGLLLWGTLGHGHNLGTSYSQWTLNSQGAEVQARVLQLQLSRLQLDPRYTPDYLAVVGERLAADLQLWAGNQRCVPSQVRARSDADGWVSAHWRVTCPTQAPRLIRTRLFEVVAPSHLHFVRVDNPEHHSQPHNQHSSQQRVLSFAAPTLALDQAETTPDTLQHFVGIGIEHILGGWDHLAFLLMLILLAGSLREVALVATGFTLAHSLTLAAASLGWIVVDQIRVEALIGFSIALVAAENLWLRSARDVWIPRLLLLALLGVAAFGHDHTPWLLMAALAVFSFCYFGLLAQSKRPQRGRLVLTFVFGLIHGFGFAGLMGELQLPPAQLTLGLLGFNLGVELGQILMIALIWPILVWLRRLPRASAWVTQGASAAVAGLGMFWFTTRLLA